MAHKKTPGRSGARRPRQPRPIMANPMSVVAARVSRLTPEERGRVMKPAQDGFYALRRGSASYEQWAAVASAVNVALAIEEGGVVRGLLEVMQAAEQALAELCRRVQDGERGAAWGRCTVLYGRELDAIRQALVLHDFQLQHISAGELHKARDLAIADIQRQGGHLIAAPADSIPEPMNFTERTL